MAAPKAKAKAANDGTAAERGVTHEYTPGPRRCCYQSWDRIWQFSRSIDGAALGMCAACQDELRAKVEAEQPKAKG